MYTNEYEKSMKSLFDFLGFKRKLSKEPTLQELLEDKTMQASLYGIMNNDERYAQAAFRNAIEAKLGDAKYGSEKYNSIIKKLLEFKGQNKKELDKFFEIFSDLENISLIKPQEGEQNIEIKKLINAIMGSKSANSSLNATSSCSNISNVIKSFIDSKKIDLESGKIKAALVTNFETRLKDGSLSNLSPEQINFARKILYSTTISDALTYTNASHKQNYWDVMDCILKDENNFRAEKEIMPEFSEITKKLHVASEHLDNPKEEYLRCSSFSASLKKYATTLFNSKTWLRKFGIMAIILVAVTLLIQPLFGNIKKEFSNESKGGNK